MRRTSSGELEASPNGMGACQRAFPLLLALVLSCTTHTINVSSWLRVERSEELTIIPHNYALGGGPHVVEVDGPSGTERLGTEGRVKECHLSADEQRALLGVEERGGTYYYAVLDRSTQRLVKRWKSNGYQFEQMLLARDGSYLVRVRWMTEPWPPQHVIVEELTWAGAVRSSRTLKLPAIASQEPRAKGEDACYYDTLIGWSQDTPVLRDVACSKQGLILTAPPRPLGPSEQLWRKSYVCWRS